MQKFKITTEHIELFKLLKVTNLCNSGGEAKHYISEGFVKVDDVVETRKACKIKAGQIVSFNRNKVIVEKEIIDQEQENVVTNQEDV